MKTYTILTATFLVLFLASLSGTLYLWELVTRGTSDEPALWIIFLDAALVPKLVMTLCLIAAPILLLLSLIGIVTARPGGPGSMATTLLVFGLCAAGLGISGALYGAMNVSIGARMTGTRSFMAVAPGIAEVLLTAAGGLFNGLIASTGAALTKRRTQTAKNVAIPA